MEGPEERKLLGWSRKGQGKEEERLGTVEIKEEMKGHLGTGGGK